MIYRREGLFEIYVEALVGLGQCASARNDHRSALRSFRRALDADPFREDIHRAIMMCYADMGDKYQVHAQFMRLKALLDEEMGIEPSDETIELLNTLLK